MSEQELVRRVREILSAQQPTAPRAPVITAVATGNAQRREAVDPLAALASRLGLASTDIEACRAGPELYEWCMALLDPNVTSPPAYPFPERLLPLLLKLIAAGKLEHGKLRLLNLDKKLVEVVAGRVASAVSAALEGHRVEAAVGELERAREVYKKMSRLVGQRMLEEEIARAVKGVAQREVEHVVLEALRGRIPVTTAVEKIVLQQSEAARVEKGVIAAAKPAEAPREPKQGVAEAPRVEK